MTTVGDEIALCSFPAQKILVILKTPEAVFRVRGLPLGKLGGSHISDIHEICGDTNVGGNNKDIHYINKRLT